MTTPTGPSFDELLDRFREARDEELEFLREEIRAVASSLSDSSSELDVALADCHFEQVREEVESVVARLREVDVRDLERVLDIRLPDDVPGTATLPVMDAPTGASMWRQLRSEDPEDSGLPEDGGALQWAFENKLSNRVTSLGDQLRAWIDQAGELLFEVASSDLGPAELEKVPGLCAEYATKIDGIHGSWLDALAELAGRAPGLAGIAGEAGAVDRSRAASVE